MSSATERKRRRPPGWEAPGPKPLGDQGREELCPRDDEDLSALSGDFCVFQMKRGHRWSLDDLVTAHVAAESVAAEPETALDLGCGIGSVLLMVAWRFPSAGCVGVEAQERSASMARRSIAWNGVTDRVTVRGGDLRDASLFAEGERFPLVTGTPPYFPVGAGVESDQPQRGPCRFEHRGGVEAYVAAAARRLTEEGLFVVCVAPDEDARVHEGARKAGLFVQRRLDVLPKEGRPPRVAVYTLGRREARLELGALVVRDAADQWTEPFRAVRRGMGMPDGGLRMR